MVIFSFFFFIFLSLSTITGRDRSQRWLNVSLKFARVELVLAPLTLNNITVNFTYCQMENDCHSHQQFGLVNRDPECLLHCIVRYRTKTMLVGCIIGSTRILPISFTLNVNLSQMSHMFKTLIYILKNLLSPYCFDHHVKMILSSTINRIFTYIICHLNYILRNLFL